MGFAFHGFRSLGGAKAEIATITGHSLRDVRSILDSHYFCRDPIGDHEIGNRDGEERARKVNKLWNRWQTALIVESLLISFIYFANWVKKRSINFDGFWAFRKPRIRELTSEVVREVRQARAVQTAWNFAFLLNHAPDIAAMDLFVLPTIGFELLYAFVIVRLDRRDLIWIDVTSDGGMDRAPDK
jgi:hypothetical protein